MLPRAVLFFVSITAAYATVDSTVCRNTATCSCSGKEGENVTICLDTARKDCIEWAKDCKDCDSLLAEECLNSFETINAFNLESQKKSRNKRQYPVRRPGNQGSGYPAYGGSCPHTIDGPKSGSIRCTTGSGQTTCTGKCLPGYSFENRDSDEEITLRCQNGVWTPTGRFPPCKSGGHCTLIAQGHGAFNCTTSMDGTMCDVHCSNRFMGRYFCFPGSSWEPTLPHCVVPKGGNEERTPPRCRCEYGGSCDQSGNCVCPVGRTGTRCEFIVAEKMNCRDPGFVSNGYRRDMDGSESSMSRPFNDGESVVYGCNTDEYALQGASYIVCEDGTWSGPLPKCIKPVVTPEVFCPDPGQVPNADRLNSDGHPSLGVEQYKVGQSVVYTCRPGFALQRRSLITCRASGSWSDPLPMCTSNQTPPPVRRTTKPTSGPVQAFCRDPGTDINGSRRPSTAPDRRGFPPGSQIEFFCKTNYELKGDAKIFCLMTGRWSENRPTCDEESTTDEYCLNPGTIQNGKFVYHPQINTRRGPQDNADDPEFPPGAQLKYSCNAQYRLEGTPTLVCQATGDWSASPPICQKESSTITLQYCVNPGAIANGRVVHVPPLNERRRPQAPATDPEYPAGTRLQYSCNSGYTIDGASTVTCETSGYWSEDPPTCNSDSTDETLYCDNPGPIQDGRVIANLPSSSPPSSAASVDDAVEYPPGTRLQYRCDEGYKLIGSPTVTCYSSGFWSPDPPLCQTECGVSRIQTTRRIIHGNKTTAGEWPWVVAIAVRRGDVNQIVCGGALLNGRTVITAAHCLESPSYVLYFGKYYRRDRNDDSKVVQARSTQVILHPDFNDTTYDSDIGLIKFAPRVRFSERIQPICLPTASATARNLMTGKRGSVTGWGLTERSLPSDELLKAELPVLTNSVCMDSYRRQNLNFPVTENMFCAGFENSQQSACSGDSGSPLVFYDTNTGSHSLEGLVSFGVQGQCGLPGRYTVFTRVQRFLPWIVRNM